MAASDAQSTASVNIQVSKKPSTTDAAEPESPYIFTEEPGAKKR
jgi:hypothetical protein